MPRRKLIEVALPLEAINLASAREKSIRHGHPSTLHLWWARRPLAACRAVLFASLVDDPSSDRERFPTPKAVEDERTRLFAIIERLVLWENSTNEAVLEEARVAIHRSTGGNPPPVLDPFCGGGSIPLEAQRLGLTAYASDLNPVPVLITKALVEIPPKFANIPPVHPDARRGVGASGTWKGAAGLAEDVRRYGTWMLDEAKRRIGHLYPAARIPANQGGGEAMVIAWLWARTVVCPNPACRARMPLVKSFELSKKIGKQAWVQPIVDLPSRSLTFEIGHSGRPPEAPKVGRGATFRCLVCSQLAPEEHIKAQGQTGQIGAQLMAVAAVGRRGRLYLAPDAEQERVAISAASPPGVLDEEMNQATTNLVSGRGYGYVRWRELFSERQLLALTTFSDLVLIARDRVFGDAQRAGLGDSAERGASAYADAVATYLAFAVDRLANYSSAFCTWNSGVKYETVTSTFGRQALPMVWDFVEANPFSHSSGNWIDGVAGVAKVVEGLPAGAPGAVRQHDAALPLLPPAAPLVSSDPPYYDNIAYADLSDYFYLWLRRSLAGIYPELFATVLTPKTGELVAASYRFGGSKSRADEHFETGLSAAFTRIREAADQSVPVTIYYAFKQAESGEDEETRAVASTGWETMLEALLGAGFSIVGTWPVRTEYTTNLKKSVGALASSIVLVCRSRSTDAGITTRKDFVATLKREMPDALRTLQHGSIAPVDLAQASIGPGMAVFSRYAKVLEPDGSGMRVRTALALINQALDEILTEQEGEFDAGTRWAIAWFEQFGLGEGAYGSAETLSKAKNSSVAGLVEAGVVAAARGRVRLLARAEYSTGWDPAKDRRIPVWEATQRLVHALLTDGEASAGDLLARLGGLGDIARDLAYRLYHVAERKDWTDEARAYNALVVAWPDLVRGAEQSTRRQPAQASLGLES